MEEIEKQELHKKEAGKLKDNFSREEADKNLKQEGEHVREARDLERKREEAGCELESKRRAGCEEA